MKHLLTNIVLALFFAAPVFADDDPLLACVTVYWRGEGQLRACSNGVALRAGHCAVDPKRIPFGSRVLFPDATCVAVDSGPAVVSRRAARVTGRTASQRSAIVIDRFFESKEAALNWAKAHPRFMTVRILPPGSRDESNGAVTAKTSPKPATPAAALPEFDSARLELCLPPDSVLRPARRT